MIQPYSQEWPRKFAKERNLIETHLGNAIFDIQHIGSTSIPGLSAKPIIDIMVAVKSLGEAGALHLALAELGYEYKPDMSSTERQFFRKGDPVEFHLSVAQPDHTPFWHRQIFFREYLIEHPEYAREYEKIKQEAIAEVPESDLRDLSRSKGYSEKKGPFIQKVLTLAWDEIDVLAQKVWGYLKLNQKIEPCDAIFVPGSHDKTTAEYAIQLYKTGYGNYLIFSGGVIQKQLGRPEAEGFAEMARAAGVPEDRIIVEGRAMNTGANFDLTRKLFEARISLGSFLVVQKPYMERRAYAVGAKCWPDKKMIFTSSPTTYTEYVSGPIPKEKILNTMVGDLQRIRIYGENGFQIPQDIPTDIWEANERLIKFGFDKRLAKAE